MYKAAHTTCHVQNPQTPVRSVTTPSNLPVKATGRDRSSHYRISHLPQKIFSKRQPGSIREMILNFPRKRKLSADCRALRTVYRAGVPRKRRRFDTASSPACPALAGASGQGHHVVTKQQATTRPRATQAPEGSKRRRIRTASSRHWPRRRSIMMGRSSSLLEWNGNVVPL